MAEVEVGKKAPSFSLPASTGGRISLSDFKGKKAVILYFYPKDNTPGCTKEACDFRDRLKELEKNGAVVLGISRDSISSHQRFAEKFELPSPLLSDEKGEVCHAYGAYGKKLKGEGIIRSTFIIDKGGIIQGIWRNVKVVNHVVAVLEFLKREG